MTVVSIVLEQRYEKGDLFSIDFEWSIRYVCY